MNGENKYIDDLIQKLKSPDPAIRAEACERLRDYPQIPLEAVQALQEAAHDPDEDVAGAARRALKVHLPPEETPEPAIQEAAGAALTGTVVGQAVPAKHFSWFEAWMKAITEPRVASFQELLDDPAASASRGLTWVGIVSLVYGLILMLVTTLIGLPFLSDYGNFNLGSSLLYVVCGVPFIAVTMVLGVMLSAAIMNLIARALGGEGNYSKLVYLVSAFSTPLLLITGVIAYIPIVNWASTLISFYMIALYVLAIMTVYKFSTGKAILTYFIPTIVACVITACIIAFMLPAFMNIIQQGN